MRPVRTILAVGMSALALQAAFLKASAQSATMPVPGHYTGTVYFAGFGAPSGTSIICPNIYVAGIENSRIYQYSGVLFLPLYYEANTLRIDVSGYPVENNGLQYWSAGFFNINFVATPGSAFVNQTGTFSAIFQNTLPPILNGPQNLPSPVNITGSYASKVVFVDSQSFAALYTLTLPNGCTATVSGNFIHSAQH